MGAYWFEECRVCNRKIVKQWLSGPCPHDHCVPNAWTVDEGLKQHEKEYNCTGDAQ